MCRRIDACAWVRPGGTVLVVSRPPVAAKTLVGRTLPSIGSWVSQYGRVWVKDNNASYLGELTVVPTGSESGSTEPVHFYSKNPALALREFSETVARSKTPAQFRMTSDNVTKRAFATEISWLC